MLKKFGCKVIQSSEETLTTHKYEAIGNAVCANNDSHTENARNLTDSSLWFWSLEIKQLFKTLKQNQNFNNKRKNSVRFTRIFCIFFSFHFLFSWLPCFKQHDPHSQMVYYKNVRAKWFSWLSWLRALKGHPEKSQLEEPWNSCGEAAAIWKGTALANSSIKSLISVPPWIHHCMTSLTEWSTGP